MQVILTLFYWSSLYNPVFKYIIIKKFSILCFIDICLVFVAKNGCLVHLENLSCILIMTVMAHSMCTVSRNYTHTTLICTAHRWNNPAPQFGGVDVLYPGMAMNYTRHEHLTQWGFIYRLTFNPDGGWGKLTKVKKSTSLWILYQ